MKIKVKFFDKDVYAGDNVLQKIGGSKSNWIDLRASQDTIIENNSFSLIPLGIAMQLPEGYEAILVPRSSTFKNFGIIQTNSIGVIDEAYCGDNDQWMFPAYCLKAKDVVYGRNCTFIKRGERICQFRIIGHQPDIEFEVVESLDNPDRGGIGSTGTL